MNIKKHIPNAITCGNLLCGCLAIVKAFEGDLVWAAYLVGIAAVLDFFDGFAARMLRVSSPIGKDLDSLADMVTFGVVPGIVMYHLIMHAVVMQESNQLIEFITNKSAAFGQLWSTAGFHAKSHSYLPFVGFTIIIFSALRLAKFNNDTRQSDSFIGLPTPANAMFICSIPLILDQHQAMFMINPYIFCGMSVVLSLLLVSELPLFSLKFKYFKWAGNEIRYVFLIISLALLIILQFIAIPLIIMLYVAMSVINNVISKNTKTS